MKIIVNGITLAIILTCSTFAAEKKVFFGETYLPDFAWRSYLTEKDVEHFVDDKLAEPASFIPGELIICYSTSLQDWTFAFFVSKKINKDDEIIFEYQRYNRRKKINEIKEKEFYKKHFRKLSPFWQQLWQPNILDKKNFNEEFKQQIQQFITKSKRQLYPQAQAAVIPTNATILVIGDLYGDLKSLSAILTKLVFEKDFQQSIDNDGKLSTDFYIVFSGNILGQDDNLDCFNAVLWLENNNPNHLFMVQGNLETEESITKTLKKNIIELFGHSNEWNQLSNTLESLPSLILLGNKTPGVEFYDFIMFVHEDFDTSWNMKDFIIEAKKSTVNNPIAFPLPNTVKQSSYHSVYPVDSSRRDTTLTTGQSSLSDRVWRYCMQVSANFEGSSCLSAIIKSGQNSLVNKIGNCGILTGNPKNPWKALDEDLRYPLSEQFTAFTFMGTRYNSKLSDAKNYAFGIITAAPNGRWYLKPYKFE